MAAAVFLLLLDAFLPGRSRELALIGASVAVVAAVLVLLAGRGAVSLGGARFAVDGAAQFARAATCALLAVFCLWASGAPADAKVPGRAISLALVSGAGALAAAGARDWLTLLLAVEVATLPLVALLGAGEGRDEDRALLLPHLVASGAATMTLAYGVSLLLTSSGSLEISRSEVHGAIGWLAAALIILGLLAKLGAAPLDVPARRAFATAPSWAVAACVSLPRIPVVLALARAVEVLAPQVPSSSVALYGAGAASMAWGLAGAFGESDLRGLAARAGALNAGFVLLALGAGGAFGLRSALFYAFAYALPSLGLMLVASEEGPALAALAGLVRRRRAAAWAIVVFSMSFVGVAPTVGFLGKLHVLGGALRSGATWAAAAGLVVSVASAVPFGRLVRSVFSAEENRREPLEGRAVAATAAIAVAVAATVLFGAATGPVLAAMGLALS